METFFYLRVRMRGEALRLGPYLNYHEAIVLATDHIEKILTKTQGIKGSEILSISVEEWCLTPEGQMLHVATRLTEEKK